MKTMKEAVEEIRQDDDEGVYCLYLTGGQARATLRALGLVAEDDTDAAAVQARLHRLREPRQPKQRTEEEDPGARERQLPPYDLPDADALLALQAVAKRTRKPRQA
ncbi:hypothetical protein ACH4YN_33295 [Streptomyces griseofuscus]|uniref:hypothetical protein n=1 Tax=Streptomyces griseofuscus TaxID=146922 RepID=UPI0037BA42F0